MPVASASAGAHADCLGLGSFTQCPEIEPLVSWGLNHLR